MQKRKSLVVLSSPSGGGKSTVAKFILNKFDNIRFSVSATTRDKRAKESEGKSYYFISYNEFQNKIKNEEFVEYEEIFGNYYGTLKSEIDYALKKNECLIFDVDVKGALSLKKAYPRDTLLIFLSAPSISELENRLRKRCTETDEQISTRLKRAEMEMNFREEFDIDIINDRLNETLKTVYKIIQTQSKAKTMA